MFLVSAETLLPQVLGAGTQLHFESSMAGPGLASPPRTWTRWHLTWALGPEAPVTPSDLVWGSVCRSWGHFSSVSTFGYSACGGWGGAVDSLNPRACLDPPFPREGPQRRPPWLPTVSHCGGGSVYVLESVLGGECLRLPQPQGLDSGFVASAGVPQSGFHSEGCYVEEGSVVQWL